MLKETNRNVEHTVYGAEITKHFQNPPPLTGLIGANIFGFFSPIKLVQCITEGNNCTAAWRKSANSYGLQSAKT